MCLAAVKTLTKIKLLFRFHSQTTDILRHCRGMQFCMLYVVHGWQAPTEHKHTENLGPSLPQNTLQHAQVIPSVKFIFVHTQRLEASHSRQLNLQARKFILGIAIQFLAVLFLKSFGTGPFLWAFLMQHALAINTFQILHLQQCTSLYVCISHREIDQ